MIENPRERLARQKERLQRLRDRARERYAGGAAGLQVASLISEMIDQFLIELLHETLTEWATEHAPDTPAESWVQQFSQDIAVVAIGGSGRGELAPFSDADILFLHRSQSRAELNECVAQVVRDCWDAGIKLGHSVRTVGDTLSSARQDPHLATSLVEARLLWGDERLVSQLTWKFRRQVQRGYAKFFTDCLAARDEERGQFGESDRQLEPDVKRSAGGLRDLHLIRWIGYACYGTPDPDLLRLEGALTQEDALALSAAHDLLMRVRTDLHFQAGKAQEILSRDEQLRLADLYDFEGTPGQRPVERFMQAFFKNSAAIADIANRFVARHRPRPFLSRIVQFLLTHRSNHFFLVGPEEISVASRRRAEVFGSLERMLNLFELSGLYSVQIAAPDVESVRQAAPKLPKKISDKSAKTFLSILGQTGHVGRLLRGMFSTGLLDLLVPAVTHARCLLQFNQYHAYTVDEHSLRAVEAAEKFAAMPGPIGAACRSIRPRHILHLALLLHDLGKGFEEDHSDLGRKIAEETAGRLGLPAALRELLMFLVQKHLNLSLVAFRRDLSDPKVIADFAREIGSPERLTMLYVVTACDMTAVGPGVWTDWKADLCTDLYDRTMLVLSGSRPEFRETERFLQVREEVAGLLAVPAGDETALMELEKRLRSFPAHYLNATAAPQVAADLRDLQELETRPVIVRSHFERGAYTGEYRVITRDRIGSGLFNKITGALTAKRLGILSASICTTVKGEVVDSFSVHDSDHTDEIPEFRIREVEQAISDVLLGKRTVESLFPRHSPFLKRSTPPVTAAEPPQAVIDNDSSDRCTVIDIFAHDQQGLLYTIASTLLELQLSVTLAKIGTHVDQVLDVFYVTDHDGGKIHDEARLRQIRETLVHRIENFSKQGLQTAVPA